MTPADAPDRDQVAALVAAVQEATGASGEVAVVAAASTGPTPAAKRGVVLLPRRGVGERSVAWASRVRRLARDDERLPEIVAGRHVVAFAGLMLHRVLNLAGQRPLQALGLRRQSDKSIV